jgi:hypothetical protein
VTIRTEGFGVVAEPPQKLPITVQVYAVVQFDGSARQVSEVVVAFENVPAAVRYATESGLADYTVAPIGFHVARSVLRAADGAGTS